MPVMRLNSVVLPAPFGPMMALRSPAMMRSVTSRVACRPPKLLHKALSSRTGTAASFIGVSVLTRKPRLCEETPGPKRGPGALPLFAKLARREYAAVDRLRQELVLADSPELADVRVGLDHGVPELGLWIAEQLLLLDLLDVDVMHRVAHVVEAHRPADGVKLEALHGLDELLFTRPLSPLHLHCLVDKLRRGVVALRVVARHLAVFGAVSLHEGFVLRRLQCGAVLQRRDVA